MVQGRFGSMRLVDDLALYPVFGGAIMRGNLIREMELFFYFFIMVSM